MKTLIIDLEVSTTETGTIDTSGEINVLRWNVAGPPGPAGADGVDGAGSAIEVFDEGVSLTTNVTSFDFVGAGVSVTNTGDAVTVEIDATGGGGGGTVESIVEGDGIDVDDTDPANPIVSLDATTADVPDSADKRYVTDAEKTKLANTSGTNTGDQDLSGLVPKTTTVNGHALSANVTVTKSDVNLGNVDNTSDVNKPVSTAQQTAIDAKVIDSIADADTSHAPSRNSVFDALALKQNALGYTAENAANKTNDTTLAGDSATLYPTEHAVKTYADTQLALHELLSNKSTDVTLGGGSPSNTLYPSQAAVKAYADGLLNANDSMQFKGVIDASANPNYPAANAGYTYKISVAGKIGGASGINVEIGDTIYCITDSSSAGNQATVGTNWVIVQSNIDGAVTGPASSTSGNLPSFNGTTGKVIQDSGIASSAVVTLTGSQVLTNKTLTSPAITSPTGLVKADVGLGSVTNALQLVAANNLSDLTNTTTARSNLGVVIGTNVQAWDADLDAIAALTSAADKLPYATGPQTWAMTDFSSFARTLVDDANASAARTTLGVAIGTNVQAWDADLDTLAALNSAGSGVIAADGAGWTLKAYSALKTSLSLTKSDVGLSNVVNLDTSTTANITDSTNKRFITDAQQTVLGNTSGTNTGDQTLVGLGGVPTSRQVNGHALSADVTVTKGDLSLGNVDNTSDVNKPVSTAQQTAIDAKVENSIVSGHTTIAPSGDAVYQAVSTIQNLTAGIYIGPRALDYWRTAPHGPNALGTADISSSGATTMAVSRSDVSWYGKREVVQLESTDYATTERVFIHSGQKTTAPIMDRGQFGDTASTFTTGFYVKKRAHKEFAIIGDSTFESDTSGTGITGKMDAWPDQLALGLGRVNGGLLGRGYLPMWHQAALSRQNPEITLYGNWSTIGPALSSTYMGPFAGSYQAGASTALTATTNAQATSGVANWSATNTFAVDDAVTMATNVPTSYATGTTYWVVAATGSTFQLSATKGGSALNPGSTPGGQTVITRTTSLVDSGDTLRYAAHGLTNDDMVFVSSILASTGLSTATAYYVVNKTTDTFQLASTIGGAALPITTNGSATVTEQAYMKVTRLDNDYTTWVETIWEDLSTTPGHSISFDNGLTWTDQNVASKTPTRVTLVRSGFEWTLDKTYFLIRSATAAGVTQTNVFLGFDRMDFQPTFGVTTGMKFHNVGYDGNTLSSLCGVRGSDDIYYTSSSTTINSFDGNFGASDVGRALKDGNNHFREGTLTGCTTTASTDKINKTSHGLNNGDRVTFTKLATTTGLQTIIQHYYVVNKGTNDFQVSASVGGSAVDLTNDGTCDLRYETCITAYSSATQVTISTATLGATTSGAGHNYIIQGTFNVLSDPFRLLRGDPGSLQLDGIIVGMTNDMALNNANSGNRTVTATITGGTTITLTAGNFKTIDTGKILSGTGFSANTSVTVNSSTTGTLSQSATNNVGVTVTIGTSESTINDIYKWALKVFDDEFSPFCSIEYWAPFEQGATRLDGSQCTAARQVTFRAVSLTHAQTYERSSLNTHDAWLAEGVVDYADSVTKEYMDGAASGFHEGWRGHLEMASRQGRMWSNN